MPVTWSKKKCPERFQWQWLQLSRPVARLASRLYLPPPSPPSIAQDTNSVPALWESMSSVQAGNFAGIFAGLRYAT